MTFSKAIRAWSYNLQTLKDHRGQPGLLYPTKPSFTIDGDNKSSHNKTKFKQYLSEKQYLIENLLNEKKQHN
jgi:hypothetical protein